MSSETAPKTPAPRLIFSLAILCISIVASLLFASAFKFAPIGEAPAEAAEAQPGHSEDSKPDTHAHDTDAKEETGPVYYTGGLWSNELGLASTIDTAILSATGAKPVVCE